MQPLNWIKQNNKSKLYRILLWTALTLSLLALWRISGVLTRTEYIPVDDYGAFWTGGKLNVEGGNPYNPADIARLKSQLTNQSTQDDVIATMWNPPWTLPLVMVFSIWSYPLSRIMWLISSITILLISFNFIWKIYDGDDHLKWFAWIIGFSLGPTISVLEKGQITPFMLLGLVGFVYWVEKPDLTKKNDLLAGACLMCATVKPQLLVPFWFALLFWTVSKKRWWIIVGASLSMLIFLIIPLIFNPHVIKQYLAAVLYGTPADWATPTFGSYFRLFWGIDKFWLQFVSPIFGIAWFFYYWLTHYTRWQWSQALPWLLLVSLLTAPYAWTYDQVLLTFPVLFIGIMLIKKSDRKLLFILLISLTAINLLDLGLHRSLDEFWFGWLAPAYLLWCIIAYALINRREKSALTVINPEGSRG